MSLRLNPLILHKAIQNELFDCCWPSPLEYFTLKMIPSLNIYFYKTTKTMISYSPCIP